MGGNNRIPNENVGTMILPNQNHQIQQKQAEEIIARDQKDKTTRKISTNPQAQQKDKCKQHTTPKTKKKTNSQRKSNKLKTNENIKLKISERNDSTEITHNHSLQIVADNSDQ